MLSVADVILTPPIDEERDDTFPFHVPDGVRSAHERAERALLDITRGSNANSPVEVGGVKTTGRQS